MPGFFSQLLLHLMTCDMRLSVPRRLLVGSTIAQARQQQLTRPTRLCARSMPCLPG